MYAISGGIRFFSYDLVDGWEAIEMNAQSDGF
jgi:hypothetical protein